jgi:hypothetical protein
MASRERLYYGLVVVGVVFVALLVSAGVRAAPTVLVNPLETELGGGHHLPALRSLRTGLGVAHGRDDGSALAAATGFREPGGPNLTPVPQQERLQLFVEGPGSPVVWQ